MERQRVLVVGGGPAGLTAALGAARAGHDVELVEASSRLGGMAASIEVAGQRVDLGSHRLHPAMPPSVRALLDELLGDDLQTRTRDGRVRIASRWIPFPFTTTQMLRALGPQRAGRMLADLATAPLRRARADTYAEVIRAGLGPTALAVFHGPMATKLWGRTPDRLAGELARRRIAVRSPLAVARRVARTRQPEGRCFLAPRLGYGSIVDRLAEAAAAAGAVLRTDTAVRGIRPGSPVEVDVGPGRQQVDRVIWTAAPGALASIAGGPATGVRHRGMVLVYVNVDGPRWSDADAHYVPDPCVPFSRISEPKNYRAGPDPTDRSVLCFEVPCDPGDAAWTRTVAQWQDRVDRDLARIGLPETGGTVEHVERLPAVYPVLTPDEVPAVDALRAWSQRVTGVTVLGRQGLIVGDNLHHVLDMAIRAVSCLDHPSGWDAVAWAQHRAAFADFVVED